MKNLIACVLFALFSLPITAANEHGSGDNIRIIFEQGRLNAVGVLQQIDVSTLPDFLKNYLHPDEYQWLLTNKVALEDDISQSAHVWADNLPTGMCPSDTCACTGLTPAADIDLAYLTCPNSVHTRMDAGQLLIHESVEHLLGAGEDRADRIATVFYMAWDQMGHSELYQCQPITPPAKATYIAPLWTGTELMFFYADGTFGFFNPSTNLWRNVTPTNSFSDVVGQQAQNLAWSGGHVLIGNLFVVYLFPDTTNFNSIPSGAIYHLDQNRWELISSTGAPIFSPARFDAGTPPPSPIATQVLRGTQVVGDKMIAWQGIHYDLETLTYGANGGIFDPKLNQWTPLPSPNLLTQRETPSVVAGDDFLLVWGGTKYDPSSHGYVPADDGAKFDLTTMQWKPISMQGALSPTNVLSRFFWTGEKVLVYSGIANQNEIYDPSTDTWSLMQNSNSPTSLEDSLSSIWTGTDLLVLGHNSLFLYNLANNAWTSRTDILSAGNDQDISLYWTDISLIQWNPDTGSLCSYYL